MKERWMKICSVFSDSLLCEKLYREIEKAYEGRYYHNLEHVKNVLDALDAVLPRTDNPEALQFAAWYHDIIYKPLRKDNEAKSALLARKRAEELSLPEYKISLICECIRKTAMHTEIGGAEPLEVQYMLDADLSQLAAKKEVFIKNTAAIRREYKLVPKKQFIKGRLKVMKGFLDMPNIYRSDYFRKHYEAKARANIADEVSVLEQNIIPGF